MYDDSYSTSTYTAEGSTVTIYYDKNNPVVKVILLVLGGIIVVGAAYYIMTYLGTR